jgi:hypothetical protein
MRKGIAIQTILLLVVGLVVVGVLVYLVYSYSSSGQLSVYECRVRLSELCTQCSLRNFGSFPLNTTLINDCMSYSDFTGWSGIDDCSDWQTIYRCRELGVT